LIILGKLDEFNASFSAVDVFTIYERKLYEENNTKENKEPTYLDIQAEVGISKHMEGRSATDILHTLLHLETAEEVLEVGCGIGDGSVYIAKKYNCRVAAVDISEKMLSWAAQRAGREGVGDRITFQKADIRELPFEDNRFDAVIVESVMAFVEDKMSAIRELIRVTRPGGYVGLNETYWIKDICRDHGSIGLHRD
jgi:ubiquinone/menaquinone biosynthesis C-methylase UbiE